ncbi:MAG: hypothetical protein MZV70_71780 [Desulfobacterales bacterium]|nr:hypothetical protein [Desulfobacterales bacterium]
MNEAALLAVRRGKRAGGHERVPGSRGARGRGAREEEPRHQPARRRRSWPTTSSGTPSWPCRCPAPTRCRRSRSSRAGSPPWATPCRCPPKTGSS